MTRGGHVRDRRSGPGLTTVLTAIAPCSKPPPRCTVPYAASAAQMRFREPRRTCGRAWGQAVTLTETGLPAMGILSDFGGRWRIVRQPQDGAIVVAKRRCSPSFETVRHRSVHRLTCRDERS